MYVMKVLLLFTLSMQLFADISLQHSYFIKNSAIYLSDIVNNPKEDTLLFKIPSSRHSKRIRAKELIERLQNLGYKDIQSKHNYIQFSIKSPINTKKIKQYVKEAFLDSYKDINIKSIHITPRAYLEKLPQNYTIELQKKFYLHKEGILSLKTAKNRKIFFNYTIDAKLPILVAKKKMKKGDEISWVNTEKKSIILEKFRAKPLQMMQKATYEAKHQIKKGSILTQRDVTGLYLIRRGAHINVVVKDAGIDISFGATANQNGRVGQSISVTNAHGKKLRVIVVGKNRAEIY